MADVNEQNPGESAGAQSETDNGEIDWSKVEIPDAVIEAHPKFKKLEKESIKHRLKAKAAKQQTPTPSTDAPETEDTDVVSAIQKMFSEFETKIRTEITGTLTERDVQSRLSNYKLSAEDAQLVAALPIEHREAAAKRLSQSIPVITEISPGSGGNTDRLKTMRDKILAKTGNNPMGDDPFSAELQEAHGGGVHIAK